MKNLLKKLRLLLNNLFFKLFVLTKSTKFFKNILSWSSLKTLIIFLWKILRVLPNFRILQILTKFLVILNAIVGAVVILFNEDLLKSFNQIFFTNFFGYIIYVWNNLDIWTFISDYLKSIFTNSLDTNKMIEKSIDYQNKNDLSSNNKVEEINHKSFYQSPWFYIPVAIIIVGGIIYFHNDIQTAYYNTVEYIKNLSPSSGGDNNNSSNITPISPTDSSSSSSSSNGSVKSEITITDNRTNVNDFVQGNSNSPTSTEATQGINNSTSPWNDVGDTDFDTEYNKYFRDPNEG